MSSTTWMKTEYSTISEGGSEHTDFYLKSICDVWLLQHELNLNSFEILHAAVLRKAKIEGKYENKLVIQVYHLDTSLKNNRKTTVSSVCIWGEGLYW